MKKNIIIVLLVILTFAFGAMSLINKIEASSQRLLAEKNIKMAMTAREEAKLAQMRALEVQRAADEALRHCTEELQKCK